MRQPPTPKKSRVVVQGRGDQYAQYREDIRADIKEACVKLDIPIMYQPGVVNTPDLSLAMFTLAVYEQLVETNRELKKLKKSKESEVDLGDSSVPAKRGATFKRKTKARS